MPKATADENLLALIARLRKEFDPEPYPDRDPLLQLIWAILAWNSTRDAADDGLERLMSNVVDVNELRVTLDHELIDWLGGEDDDPLIVQRVMRLREALTTIYLREYLTEMTGLTKGGKKEAREYLDTLPGVPPYAAASVMVTTQGAHALPVDEKLVALLRGEGLIGDDDPTDAASVENMFLRSIKAGNTLEAHLLLQAWSDAHDMPQEALDAATAPTTVALDEGAAPPAMPISARVGGDDTPTTRPKRSTRTARKK